MINIPLIDNWKIISDKYEFKLVRTDNKGRNFIEGHYSSIEFCIQSFMGLKIRLSSAESMEDLIKEIKSLQTALSKVLQPLNLRVESIK